MKVLNVIVKQVDLIDEISEQLKEIGVHHGTIIDANSMTKSLSPWSDDSIIMGGVLRRARKMEYYEECKMLIFVLQDEQVKPAIDAIEKACGDMDQPETAVMFTVPVDFAEGLAQ